MELGKAIEFAQAVWPIAKVVVPALFALGWVSPAFPTRKRKDGRGRIDNGVVEKSASLFGKINAAKDLGHKPKLSDKINLTIFNITRGAFIHRAIFHLRVDKEIARLRSEIRNSK